MTLKISCIFPKHNIKPVKSLRSCLPGILLCCFFIACTNKKETARSLVLHWCELTEKIENSRGSEREVAERELKKFEYEMDRKYHRTDPIMREAQDLLDKGCEQLLKEK